jgi:4-carboxymuconolactone decarboxylase
MSDEQRALYEAILGGKRGPGMRGEDGALVGPFNAMLLNPHVGDRVQRLGEALRFDISLPRNVIEVATLVVGSHWRAQFEWWAHERLARQAGVSETVISAIKRGERPDFSNDEEAEAYEVASELYHTQRLTDTTYVKAVQRFGESGVFELIALVGYYSLVSLLLNGFDVPLPAGQTPPFND